MFGKQLASNSDKQDVAVRLNLKEDRYLKKNIQILELEKTYSANLMDLNKRMVHMQYKRLKDRVSKIKSNLNTEEIMELRKLELEGKITPFHSTPRSNSASRIEAHARHLKINGYNSQPGSGRYTKQTMTPGRYRPQTAIAGRKHVNKMQNEKSKIRPKSAVERIHQKIPESEFKDETDSSSEKTEVRIAKKSHRDIPETNRKSSRIAFEFTDSLIKADYQTGGINEVTKRESGDTSIGIQDAKCTDEEHNKLLVKENQEERDTLEKEDIKSDKENYNSNTFSQNNDVENKDRLIGDQKLIATTEKEYSPNKDISLNVSDNNTEDRNNPKSEYKMAELELDEQMLISTTEPDLAIKSENISPCDDSIKHKDKLNGNTDDKSNRKTIYNTDDEQSGTTNSQSYRSSDINNSTLLTESVTVQVGEKLPSKEVNGQREATSKVLNETIKDETNKLKSKDKSPVKNEKQIMSDKNSQSRSKVIRKKSVSLSDDVNKQKLKSRPRTSTTRVQHNQINETDTCKENETKDSQERKNSHTLKEEVALNLKQNPKLRQRPASSTYYREQKPQNVLKRPQSYRPRLNSREFSSHAAVEKELARDRSPSPIPHTSTFRSKSDFTDGIVENIEEDIRVELLNEEHEKAAGIDTKVGEFMERLTDYLKENSSNPASSCYYTRNTDKAKPVSSFWEIQRRRSHANRWREKSGVKKLSRDEKIWKDIRKCTYLRISEAMIDFSGIKTLATDQEDRFRILRAGARYRHYEDLI